MSGGFRWDDGTGWMQIHTRGQFQGVIHDSQEWRNGPIGAERAGHASQGDGLGQRLNGCGGWISI
jgi:hypothetical protein